LGRIVEPLGAHDVHDEGDGDVSLAEPTQVMNRIEAAESPAGIRSARTWSNSGIAINGVLHAARNVQSTLGLAPDDL